jgi:hypothetical protein
MDELRVSCAVAGSGLPLSPMFGYKHPTIMTAPYTISSDHLGNFAVCDVHLLTFPLRLRARCHSVWYVRAVVKLSVASP